MNDLSKNKLETLGFKVNHFALIGVFVFLLLGITFLKDPILLENITSLKFLQAEENGVEEQVIQAVEAEPVSEDGIQEIVDQKNEMMSLLDPTFGEGSVLGLSTEAEETVKNILNEESIAYIPVKQVEDSEKNINVYISQVSLVESYHGQTVILSAISTRDPAAAQNSIPLLQSLIAELKGIEVPTPFAHYHRLKLMQNAVLLNMADTIATAKPSKDRAAAGILFFEVTNELEAERGKLMTKYSYPL